MDPVQPLVILGYNDAILQLFVFVGMLDGMAENVEVEDYCLFFFRGR